MSSSKIFTTASILSVAGAALVAVACSSSSSGDGSTGDGGTSSSGGSLLEGGTGGGKCQGAGNIDVGASPAGPSIDAGGGGDAGDADGGTATCPDDTKLSSAALDKAIGWKCPSGGKGACTNAEIDTISKNLDDTSIKSFFDVANGVSDACKACAVSKDTDPAWAPIVGLADTNGEAGIINYGACFGYLIGASCGRSVQYLEFCLDQACGDCVTSAAEQQECVKAASTGTCKGFADSLAKECPLLANAQDQCADVVSAIKTVCGP